GMASTKWVTKIRAEAAPSDNHWFARGYHYVYPGENAGSAPPVQEMKVKSVITRPLEGSRVPRGRVRVQGFAWAGPAGVKRVEISTDRGSTWLAAPLTADQAPGAWRAWLAELEIAGPVSATVMARATDGNDEV